MTNEVPTRAAIVEASKHPLSIVVVGVGDGPWGQMDEFGKLEVNLNPMALALLDVLLSR